MFISINLNKGYLSYNIVERHNDSHLNPRKLQIIFQYFIDFKRLIGPCTFFKKRIIQNDLRSHIKLSRKILDLYNMTGFKIRFCWHKDWHESIKPWISRYLISLKYENLFTFPHFVQNNLTVNYYFKGKIDCQTDCIVSAITFQDIVLIRCQLSIKDELWSLRMGNGLYTRFLPLFV